uniref:CoA transferase n=1 Tax=Thauera sp. SDU_THAU2 TaxID=3136633 RepID=UPI00311F031A
MAKGEVIDVALNEAVFNVMESLVPEYGAFGAVREPAGSALPGIAPSNAYRCSDGVVLVAGNGDGIFKRLMQAIGREDLASDPGLADNAGRVARVAQLDEAIGGWTASRTVAQVLQRLDEARVPAGRVYTAKDIVEDPHYRARDMLLRQVTQDGHELEVPGVVPKLLGTPGSVRSAAPKLGQDTDAVLRGLGLDTPPSPRCAAGGDRMIAAPGRPKPARIAASQGEGTPVTAVWRGARHIFMPGGGPARRVAGRAGLRADRGKDRADQCVVASRSGQDRGDFFRLAQGHSRVAGTPRSCCARSSAILVWSMRRWCRTSAVRSRRSSPAPTG